MRRQTIHRSAARVVTPAVVGSIALSLTVSPAADARAAERPVPAQRAATPLPAKAASVVRTAATAPTTHTVVPGDTVSAIAAKHRLRTADVLSWNGLGWRSTIHPGDKLRLTPPSSAAAAPAKKTAAASAPARKTVKVKAGDTLWSISRAAGVSVAALQKANGLGGSSLIRVGQSLKVPGAAPAVAATRAAAVTPAPAPAKKKTSVTVAKGDTLWAIAAEAGVGLTELLAANGLGPSSIIYPGQKLTIPVASDVVLDKEQIANVRTIISVGRERGVSDRGIAIALATAMVESWIRNLDWGDRDSLGLFQQRPSAGWGTPEQVRDPRRAAAAFFGGPRDPNGTATRGLLDIPGWQKMGFAEAAQAVQVSAYPARYGPWEKQAYSWLRTYG